VDAALELIDAARLEGLDVAADQYPYSASSTTLTSQLPNWALDGGISALLRRLADPGEYRRLETALAEGAFRPERVVLAGMPQGPYRRLVGLSVAEAATALDRSPERTVLDVLAATDAQVAIVSHSMSEDDVRTVMRHPAVAVASDGWVLHCPGEGRPHPRSFGTFARVLGHYTRGEGLLELRETVRKMTSLPASRLGWTDRGVLRAGAIADVVVFDPATVTDHATYDKPWQPATGVLHTLLAGRPVVEGGEPTDTPAGRVLRGGAAAAS
jgi:N-acyl-D-amino-acid deacylase